MTYLLYFIAVFLTTYTDSPLTKYFGAFGFSMLPLMTYCVFFFLIIRGKLIIPDFCKKYLKVLNWALFVSIAIIPFCFMMGVDTNAKGENIVIKSVKVYATLAAAPLFMSIICYWLRKMQYRKWFAPFFYINIFLAVFAYLESLQLPYAFMSLHTNSTNMYWRVRLLTQESSHTAPLIELFFVIALYYSICIKKSKLFIAVTVGCFLVQLSVTSSKSLLVVLILAAGFGLWSYIKMSRNSFKLYAVLGLVGIIAYFAMNNMHFNAANSFSQDIEEGTSTVTRAITNLSGYLTGLMAPLGMGYYMYLVIMPRMIPFVFQQIGMSLNFGELDGMVNGKDDSVLISQSFFGQGCNYWGIVGCVLIFRYLLAVYKKCIRHCEKNEVVLFKIAFFIIIVNLCTVSFFDFIYQVVLSMMILKGERMNKNIHNKLQQQKQLR